MNGLPAPAGWISAAFPVTASILAAARYAVSLCGNNSCAMLPPQKTAFHLFKKVMVSNGLVCILASRQASKAYYSLHDMVIFRNFISELLPHTLYAISLLFSVYHIPQFISTIKLQDSKLPPEVFERVTGMSRHLLSLSHCITVPFLCQVRNSRLIPCILSAVSFYFCQNLSAIAEDHQMSDDGVPLPGSEFHPESVKPVLSGWFCAFEMFQPFEPMRRGAASIQRETLF